MPRRRAAALLAVLLALALGACRTELHRGLTEREANEIVAALLRQGIPAERTVEKDRSITVSVDQNRFVAAVETLRANGLPRPRFTPLTEVFPGDGLIASPTGERARLMHALGQELSRTLSGIDGVLEARVHVVVPEPDPLRREQQPATAAVLVRHDPASPVAQLLPQIKLLVANGVAGLSYDRVSVTMVPAAAAPTAPDGSGALVPVAGLLWVDRDSAGAVGLLLGIGAAALAAALAAAGWIAWQSRDAAAAALGRGMRGGVRLARTAPEGRAR